DAEGPAVHAEHELVERLRIAAGEEQHDAGEEDEQTHESSAAIQPVDARPRPGAADEHADDEVVRDGEQPPLDEYEPARERLRVCHLEPGRIIRYVLECEGWVLVGGECAVAVEADPPGPAEHADVEVEQSPRVAAGEEDREESDHGDDGGRG